MELRLLKAVDSHQSLKVFVIFRRQIPFRRKASLLLETHSSTTLWGSTQSLVLLQMWKLRSETEKIFLYQQFQMLNKPGLIWNSSKQSKLHQTISERPFSAAWQIHPFAFLGILSWLKSQFISFCCFSLTVLLNRPPSKISIFFIFVESLWEVRCWYWQRFITS